MLGKLSETRVGGRRLARHSTAIPLREQRFGGLLPRCLLAGDGHRSEVARAARMIVRFESQTENRIYVERRGLEPLTPNCQCEDERDSDDAMQVAMRMRRYAMGRPSRKE